MKKLFFICLMLFTWSAFAFTPPVAPPQLSYRFVKPVLVHLGTPPGADFFRFDVEVKSNIDVWLWAAEIHFIGNNTALNLDGFTITLAPAFGTDVNSIPDDPYADPLVYSTKKYQKSTSVVSGICKIGIIPNSPDLVKLNTPSSADFVQITSSYIKIVTISIPILSGSSNAFAGIDFSSLTMEGNQQYITSPSTFEAYPSPNGYDSHNFLTTYLGRIYSTGVWSQSGVASGTSPRLDWSTAVGTTVWDGTATMPAGVANATALNIQSPTLPPYTTLTIPVTGQVTVTGSPGVTTIDTNSKLIIQSGATGTGSLITNSVVGTGLTDAQTYLTTGRWHLVSSPVVETVQAYMAGNSATKIALKGGKRGIMDYNSTTNGWNAFFDDGGSTYGSIGSAKGFCLRSDANDFATATGALQAGTVMPSVISNAWNCIGNPYSSAMGINTSAGTTENFLTVNQASLSAVYGAVYIWDNVDANNATGSYTAISNVPTPTGTPTIQQGQGFLVRVASPTYLTFNETMQLHAPSLAFKSATKVWPTIKLNATVNNINSSTIIAYNGGMTKGLDPTYDAGLLKGESDLFVYTKLVNGNEDTPFTIQALPDNNYNGMVIPVGIDSKTGGEVVFSAETFDLPSSAKVILEDKVAGKFTDLSTASYKAVIAPNTSVADRFFLHNSMSTVSALGGQNASSKLNVYVYQNVEIRIEGEVTSEAVATLYDVTGKAVIIKKLNEGQLNVIPVTSFSSGLYLLSVKEGAKSQTFKIILRD